MARPKTPITRDALDRAMAIIGGPLELARLTAWPKTTIYSMCQRGQCAPDKAIKIEQLTGGAVTRQELRPDFPWEAA